MAELETFRLVGTAYRKMLPPQARDAIADRLGPEARKGIRAGASLLLAPAERLGRARAQHRLRREAPGPARRFTTLPDGRTAHLHTDLSPMRAREANHAEVTKALAAWRIPHFTVPGLDDRHSVIAVPSSERPRALRVLQALMHDAPGTVVGVLPAPRRPSPRPGDDLATWRSLGKAKVLRLTWLRTDPTRQVVLGADSGVEIEFWNRKGDRLTGPRQNRIMRVVPADAPVVREPLHRFSRYSGAERTRTLVETRPGFASARVDEVGFPVDAVLVWPGAHTDAHPAVDVRAALTLAALRSLEQHAPWVRTVHLIASAPPAWIRRDHPGLRIVAPSAAMTPLPGEDETAAIRALEARMHQLPDLAEQFLYLPVGSLLGRPLPPDFFFTPSGLARFRVGHPSEEDVFPAWSRILEREHGRRGGASVPPGIQSFRRSILEGLGDRLTEARILTDTGRPDPLAALHHFDAQCRGAAVQRDGSHLILHVDTPDLDVRLRRLELRRDTDLIHFRGHENTADDSARRSVRRFLAGYLPVPSEFEK